MLKSSFSKNLIEAGCDEAGRGCLAGPVFAAAVVLPRDFRHRGLNDSKKLTERSRGELRKVIEAEALAWYVASCSAAEIDEINILNASFLAMNRAVEGLAVVPELLLIDGNRFRTSCCIAYECVVGGDGKYASIAAASVLAKTYRDDYMAGIAVQYPAYGWDGNKGYPTAAHRDAIRHNGLTAHHRKTFRVK